VKAGLILSLTVRGLAVGDYPRMREIAQRAESHGFDSVWLCDHFLTLPAENYRHQAGFGTGSSGEAVSSMPLLECWTALSALSRDTTKLRLGTSVLCASYRHPAVLAKMAATLDVICEGRLDLGIGAGWFQREYEAYGIDFPPVGERVGRLAESIDVLTAVWTQENPTFAGRYYRIDGAVCDPRPVQRPHPPIWVGGEGARVQRIAARAAAGLNVRWWSPERVRARRAFLDEACHAAGRDPATLQMSLTAMLAPVASTTQAERLSAEFAAIPADGRIIGTPEFCRRRIEEYVAAGIHHFLFTIPHVADNDLLDRAGDILT
jgi:F420-dependent oxidoreductase-like protein